MDPVDFSNTQIAFAHKSNAELRYSAWLFRMMNYPFLVKLGSAVMLFLKKIHLPILNPVIRHTIFKQFCGGTTLENTIPVVNQLTSSKVLIALDYGVEAKESESDFDSTLKAYFDAIEFASTHKGVPVVSAKVTGLGRHGLLEKQQAAESLTSEEQQEWSRLEKRLFDLGKKASEKGVALFIDAEETWIQDSIDALVKQMMEDFNKGKVVVYHTYQIYRKDKLESLKNDFQEATNKGYWLGAKIVRGAYMEKERRRADEQGYPSPIQDNKEATDKDFNEAIYFCVENYQTLASCNASHNLESNLLQARLLAERGIPRNHRHLNFCQLFGMSDYITFNLANAGFNVGKYTVYGPVNEVIPYLIRRAQENSSVSGEVGRELGFLLKELDRRGI